MEHVGEPIRYAVIHPSNVCGEQHEWEICFKEKQISGQKHVRLLCYQRPAQPGPILSDRTDASVAPAIGHSLSYPLREQENPRCIYKHYQRTSVPAPIFLSRSSCSPPLSFSLARFLFLYHVAATVAARVLGSSRSESWLSCARLNDAHPN